MENAKYKDVLVAIFGSKWRYKAKDGEKILDYVLAHPDWNEVKKSLSVDEVMARLEVVFEERYKNPLSHYFQKSRQRDILDKRKMVYLLLQEICDVSLSEMGRMFGYKHSTILHDINSYKDLLSYEARYKREYEIVKNQIFKENEK